MRGRYVRFWLLWCPVFLTQQRPFIALASVALVGVLVRGLPSLLVYLRALAAGGDDLHHRDHVAAADRPGRARNLIMDLGEQTHRVKFMIRDRGPDFTAAFDAAPADAGIWIVLCNVQTPRMNAIIER